MPEGVVENKMAITPKITGRTAAVAIGDSSTEFVTTGPFVLHGDDFLENEKAELYRLGPSGLFRKATNENGVIGVSARPNMVFVDVAGTYRVTKDVTKMQASVGYEEQ